MEKLVLIFLAYVMNMFIITILTPKNQNYKIHFPKESQLTVPENHPLKDKNTKV